MASSSSNKSSCIDTLTINGVDYVRADSLPTQSIPLGPVQIIVADKGFVFVGNVQNDEDGIVTLTNAKNIRIWGTTKGLGELVNGPTSKTVFDNYGTVQTTPILRIAVVKGW
jgi:hypothetical protein